MLGGFFAGDGIDYFGDIVSITPEDVYCYTIGTPRTIKDGLDKNVELSVSANRDSDEYKDDTEGEASIEQSLLISERSVEIFVNRI